MIRLKCKRCGYEWGFKGESPYYATCPRCYNKVNISSGAVNTTPKQEVKNK